MVSSGHNIANDPIAASSGKQLIKAIETRHSTRQFLPNTIPDEAFRAILLAADLAPSAKDRKPWLLKNISSTETKDALASIMESKVSILEVKDPVRVGTEMSASVIRQAPTLIVVCNSQVQACDAQSHLTDLLSIGAAVENMIVAAASLNVQSLWLCDVLEAKEEIEQYLGLENPLICALLLGYEVPGVNCRECNYRESCAVTGVCCHT